MSRHAPVSGMRADVAQAFGGYPEPVRDKLLALRKVVVDVAREMPETGKLEETLKWGAPSYVAKRGSTIRIGWSGSRPDHYAMYFNCNSKLVDTLRQVYSDVFTFQGNRAIVFHMTQELPTEPLRHCVSLALRYHDIKHLPLLGAVRAQ